MDDGGVTNRAEVNATMEGLFEAKTQLLATTYEEIQALLKRQVDDNGKALSDGQVALNARTEALNVKAKALETRERELQVKEALFRNKEIELLGKEETLNAAIQAARDKEIAWEAATQALKIAEKETRAHSTALQAATEKSEKLSQALKDAHKAAPEESKIGRGAKLSDPDEATMVSAELNDQLRRDRAQQSDTTSAGVRRHRDDLAGQQQEGLQHSPKRARTDSGPSEQPPPDMVAFQKYAHEVATLISNIRPVFLDRKLSMGGFFGFLALMIRSDSHRTNWRRFITHSKPDDRWYCVELIACSSHLLAKAKDAQGVRHGGWCSTHAKSNSQCLQVRMHKPEGQNAYPQFKVVRPSDLLNPGSQECDSRELYLE
ncbi:hypothetical protein OQA88_2343 [Cercophora sp. LCS_1]